MTKDKATSPFSARYVLQRRVYERNRIAKWKAYVSCIKLT